MTHDRRIASRKHLGEINGSASTRMASLATAATKKEDSPLTSGGATTDLVSLALSAVVLSIADSEMPRVKLADFEILKVLGKGAYGKVYQVRKTSGHDAKRIFAMKSVSKSRIASSKTDMRHTRTERDVLVKVDHPFLIKMHYAFETSRRLYLVQEFCRGGELFRLMETEKMFMEDQARFYLCEIVCALEYLHGLDIVYRDLKTENIMLDDEGHIKLIDFGLSKIFEDGNTLTQTFCGTVEYMAPEVLLRCPGHGKAADWWSLGIFMFDLLSGRSPFHSNNGKKDTKERILKGRLHIPPYISMDAADLLRKLIRRNIDRRLGSSRGAAEVKAHRFFTGISWRQVELRAYLPPHVPDLDRFNETDVSQFDPKFTSRTPRESERGDVENQSENDDGPFAKMFTGFDYVSSECAEAMEGLLATRLDGELMLDPVVDDDLMLDPVDDDDLVLEPVNTELMMTSVDDLLALKGVGDLLTMKAVDEVSGQVTQLDLCMQDLQNRSYGE